MDTVTFIEVDEGIKGITTHAVITREDGSATSMPKSTYDAQQAAIANFIFPSVEETAPEEEAPPVEEETI